jgi:MFS family permease
MFKPAARRPTEAGLMATLLDSRPAIAPTRGLLTVLLVGQAMATMDGSILTIMAETVRRDLPTSDPGLRLILAGYLFAFAVLVVTGARLGDRWGHRTAFLAGLVGFTLASLGCGLAPNTATLVVTRVAQGAAGALMVPQVLSLIQLRYTGARRARAIGLYSMVLALGVSLGQFVGGLIVRLDPGGTGWRAAFLVNGPIGAVLFLVAYRRLRAGRRSDRPPALDLGGVALLSAAMVAVLAPMVFGPEAHWPLWTFVSFGVGFAGLVVFVWYEQRLIDRGGAPLLDLRAVTPAGVKAALLACMLIMGGYFAFVLVLTLDLQTGHGFSALGAAVAFVPYSAGFATASLTWARLPAPARRWLPMAGPLAFAAGALGIGLLAGHGWPALATSPLLFLAGAGHAGTFSPLVGWVVERAGPAYASAVSALTTTAPQLAATLTLAGIGGLYLSAPPGAGLPRVALALVVILVTCLSCTLFAMTRGPSTADPPPATA